MAATNQPERRYGVRHARDRPIWGIALESMLVSLGFLAVMFFAGWISSATFPREGILPAASWPDAEPAEYIPVRERHITTWMLENDVEALQNHIALAVVEHGGQALEQYDHQESNAKFKRELRVVLSESQADALEESLSTTRRQIRFGPQDEIPYVRWAATGHLPEASPDEKMVTAVVAPLILEFDRAWVCIIMTVLAIVIPLFVLSCNILGPKFSEAKQYQSPS